MIWRRIAVAFASTLVAVACGSDGSMKAATGQTDSSRGSFYQKGSVGYECFGESKPSFKPNWDNSEGLLAARRGFSTQRKDSVYEAGPPAPRPPVTIFERIRYRSPVGELSAYITPDSGDGRKHPAVLWAHGGFGGIDDWFWEATPPTNDQTAQAFRNAGIVLMIPSWRGENDNPGHFEMFMGELDDLLAAREYLAQLPYVDNERIYLAGHSTGGTLSLLAAVAPADFRAVFSFGGWLELASIFFVGPRSSIHGIAPFDYCDMRELMLRTPAMFVRAIRAPTYYFEGEHDISTAALLIGALAEPAGVPLEVFEIEGGDHFDVLAPVTQLLAAKIIREWQTGQPLDLTESEVQDAYNKMFGR